jgi:L-ascorbate metabolism protein UlaG (beta-lactamase superfamily)
MADAIFVTHDHYDHCSLEDIMKIAEEGTAIFVPAGCQSKIAKIGKTFKINIVEPGQEFEFNGAKIRTVPAYNMNTHFHPKDEDWMGYIIEIAGVRFYHAGDTDMIPEMASLGKIDVAFLPVDGHFNMKAGDAAKAAMLIKPELAIPMHYGAIVGTKEDALRFVELCQNEGIRAEII